MRDHVELVYHALSHRVVLDAHGRIALDVSTVHVDGEGESEEGSEKEAKVGGWWSRDGDRCHGRIAFGERLCCSAAAVCNVMAAEDAAIEAV